MSAVVLVFVAGFSMTGLTIASTTQPAKAAANGCDNADSATGTYADTICWFDLAGFDQARAQTAAGQDFTVTLDGGYTATFNLIDRTGTGRSSHTIEAVAPPAFAAHIAGWNILGTPGIYTGIGGRPVLYSQSGAALGENAITLRDITVRDSAGTEVEGFAFVSVDAEATSPSEQLIWQSDVPLTRIDGVAANQAEGCPPSPPGNGTTTMTCTGLGSGGHFATMVQASAPSTFTTTMRESNTGERQGVAFGIMTAQVEVVKAVDSRLNPSDSFDVSIASPQSTVLGSATTGMSDTATSGGTTLIPRAAGDDSFVLGEAATTGSGTSLSDYSKSWACVNANASSTTALPTSAGTHVSVVPVPGDDITCTVTNTAIQEPAIELAKTVDATQLAAGGTLTYTFTATNTGNSTLSGVVIGEDSFTGSGPVPVPSCTPSQPTTLAPAARLVCTATYTVTPADVEAGEVDNVASATGTDPAGTVVTDHDDATVPATSVVGLEIDKRVASITDVNDNRRTDLGDEINFMFEVTNTGNVALTKVGVSDPLVGAVICARTTLAAHAVMRCEPHAPYVITQADVDAGVVHNVATASGTPPSGTIVTSSPGETETRITRRAAMTMDKRISEVIDVNGNDSLDTGDEIAYAFEVTNTGTTTLTGVAVDDPKLAGHGITTTCDPSMLGPDESVVCTADSPYVVTAADVAHGRVHNVAAATADAPQGVDVPAPAQDVSNHSTGPTHDDSDPCDCTLPNTGAPVGLWWWVTGGVLLVAAGSVLLTRGSRGPTTGRVQP